MDVQDEIEELRKDVIWARHYLNQYKKLYLNSQSRIELLNEIAPIFFRDIEKMYWDEMIISVARLTDPHVQGSYRNLSLKMLPKLAKDNHWTFEKELEDLVNMAIIKAEATIKARMKRVAHRDLPTAMGNAKLDPVDIKEIDEVLEYAGKALNLVYEKITGAMWSWDLVSSHDADTLIHHLKHAIIYKDSIKDDWQRESDDWRNSRYKET